MSEKIKALLATGRISNLPTVWCNCLAAALILFHSSNIGFQEIIQQPWSQQLTNLSIYLVLISSCFYVGGCFYGDFTDRKFDAKHKPERPIPSGIISATSVIVIGLALMLFALIGGAILQSVILSKTNANYTHGPLIFLLVAITMYSQHHKKSLFIGLPLIGSCRFFLVLFGAFSASILLGLEKSIISSVYVDKAPYFTSPIILFASAVCLYTICFASVARTESSDSPITWRNVLRYTMLGLPFVALISKAEFYGNYLSISALVAFAVYALWLLRAFQFLEKNKGAYVSRCLAGFCLLDACFVAQFGWIWFGICIGLFGFSLLLQKVAPAT